MVARDSQHSTRAPRAPRDCLSSVDLATRLDEEVSRAERHHTALSCLLVSLDDIERLVQIHGRDLPVRALTYLGEALGRELRRFDRVGYAAEGELLVVLPGADERHGEIVARRALSRFHSVKIEVDGRRQPLRISVGIAAWHSGLTAMQLLSQTRIAAQRRDPTNPRLPERSDEPALGTNWMPTPLRRS